MSHLRQRQRDEKATAPMRTALAACGRRILDGTFGARRLWRLAFSIALLQSALWSIDVTRLGADTPCPVQEGWTRLIAPEPGWEPHSAGSAGTRETGVYTVAADWDESGVLYVGGRHALYRTSDCGATWSVVWQPRSHEPYPITTLASAPDGRLYLGSGLSRPLLASDDYGRTTREVERLLMPITLEAAPSNPDVAYLLAWYGGGNRFPERRPRLTSDGGKSWSQISSIAPSGAAIIDPGDSSTVYVLRQGVVLVSTDAAQTFSSYSVYDAALAEGGSGQPINASGAAAMSADGSRTWYISSGGRVWYRGLDRAVSWQQLPDAPLGDPVQRIVTDPHDPTVFYVVAHGDELWAYREPDDIP